MISSNFDSNSESTTIENSTSSTKPQKSSYSFKAWLRLKNVCQALRQTEEKVRTLKSEIETKLKNTEKLREKKAELQACRMSVHSLETRLENCRTNVRTVAGRLTKIRHRAADFQIRTSNFYQELDELRTEFGEKQRIYIGTREKLIWAAAQLFMRRRQMVQELRTIFFVEIGTTPPSHPSGKSTSGACNCKSLSKIINVHLPDAEDYYGHNEMDLAVGLSFVVQALLALSRIFDFPLRYGLELFGSRSSVSDSINPHLPANQRIFPLFGRNQDKVAFQYGVFLLNKNIAQLRCDCGTFTQDLRCTLDNLRGLFDHVADAKLEPYSYITRAVRIADGSSTMGGDDSFGSPSTTSIGVVIPLRPKSPSSSSGGAPSVDSGDRSFRLEIPASKLASIGANRNVSSTIVDDSSTMTTKPMDGLFALESPVYSKDSRRRTTNTTTRGNNNDGSIDGGQESDRSILRGNGDQESATNRSNLREDEEETEYKYKFTTTAGNSNGNNAVNKELLRTCYLTADDDSTNGQFNDGETTKFATILNAAATE